MTDTLTETRLNPSELLMNLLIALLAPMFIGVAGGNVAMARLAALETVNAYRARNHADLIAVVQIVAFGLAALGSLSLSIADDLTLNMTLRLRGNANACNRSAEQNRCALRDSRYPDSLPDFCPPPPFEPEALEPEQLEPATPEPEPAEAPFLSPTAEDFLAAEAEARLHTPALNAAETRDEDILAQFMLEQADELKASLPHLPPSERHEASLRMEVLNSTAHDLLNGIPAVPVRSQPVPPAPGRHR